MIHTDVLRPRALKFFETQVTPATTPEQLADLEGRLKRLVSQIDDPDMQALYRQELMVALRAKSASLPRQAESRAQPVQNQEKR